MRGGGGRGEFFFLVSFAHSLRLLRRLKQTQRKKTHKEKTDLGSLNRSKPKIAGSSFHCRPVNALRRLSRVEKWFLTMPLMRPSVQNLSCEGGYFFCIVKRF